SVDSRVLPSFPTRRSSDLCLFEDDGQDLSSIPISRRRTRLPHQHTESLIDSCSLRSLPGAMLHGQLVMPEGHSSLPLMFLIKHRSEEHTSELQSRGHLVCR